jgi:hypothetical protein
MNDHFSKWRAHRTVLVRTRKRPDLPESLLYVGGDGGDGKRAMLDPEGKEQRIADAILQSQYKLATGSEADSLIAEHWAKAQPKPQKPAKSK